MISILNDLKNYRRTIEGKSRREYEDSTTPSKVVGEGGLKLEIYDQ